MGLPNRQFALAFALCLLSTSARAATWQVERDGSGDFVVIQDAVNAAASGDTILLGPGRFNEHGPFMPGTVTIYDAYVGVDDISLTFIGSGQGVTIVGPAVAPFQTQEIGFVLAAESAQTVRIESLILENLDKGLTAEVVRVLCQDVEFRDSETGAFLYQSVASAYQSCRFDNCRSGLTATSASNDLEILDCDFTLAYWHAVNLSGVSQGLLMQDSRILVSRFGLFFSQGSIADLNRCLVDTAPEAGMWVQSGASVTLNNVTIQSVLSAVDVNGNAFLGGSGNIFRGGTLRTLSFTGGSTSGLQNNDILKGTGPSVLVDSYLEPRDIDLRNNFWGTTDPDSIAAWIIDSNDNHNPPLDPNYGTVLYEPFLLRSIPTTTSSVGSLKALFRGQH